MTTGQPSLFLPHHHHQQPNKKIKIALDFGGVIKSMVSDDPLDGALEGIATLLEQGHSVILISKCGPNFKPLIIEWLKSHNLSSLELYFCDSYDGKVSIATSQKIDVMIDDKIQVLKTFPSSIRCLWLCDDFQKISGTKKYQPEIFSQLQLVQSWSEVLDFVENYELA
jgi:hypothetical protein